MSASTTADPATAIATMRAARCIARAEVIAAQRRHRSSCHADANRRQPLGGRECGDQVEREAAGVCAVVAT
jgi:hypothetical protein